MILLVPESRGRSYWSLGPLRGSLTFDGKHRSKIHLLGVKTQGQSYRCKMLLTPLSLG